MSEAELEVIANAASDAWPMEADESSPGLPVYSAAAAAYNVALDFSWWGGAPAFQPPAAILRDISTDPAAEATAQGHILRDIYNPFTFPP
jgi:hypothetical protein